jgi:hypothetical protein
MMPSGSSLCDLIQLRRLLSAGGNPPAASAHTAGTPRAVSTSNRITGMATSKNSVGSTSRKLKLEAGGVIV